ncbi:hypothetical protein NSP_7780 [Nodularia spumigena CCY9414]|nr:hypothetical protein NSP_7780 [Nodularia spumigena CCY9414]
MHQGTQTGMVGDVGGDRTIRSFCGIPPLYLDVRYWIDSTY